MTYIKVLVFSVKCSVMIYTPKKKGNGKSIVKKANVQNCTTFIFVLEKSWLAVTNWNALGIVIFLDCVHILYMEENIIFGSNMYPSLDVGVSGCSLSLFQYRHCSF
jgi:hypothetical protein